MSHDRVLADALALIECESPSSDPVAVRRALDIAHGMLAEIGCEAELLEIDGRCHLRYRGGGTGRRVLLLGHLDTVWPHGSIERMPAGVSNGVLTGPGCFDMKLGAAMSIELLRRLGKDAAVTLLLTSDEEIGSHTSRALIEATAAECDAVLVLEASAKGGAVKTARKGVSEYRLTVVGRAAHAGLEPERGINATLEIAALALRIASFADLARGTSVTPTVITGGTTLNTVPERATLSVDVRAWTSTEQQRVDRAMRHLRPTHAEARCELDGGIGRAPLEPAMTGALLAMLRSESAALGRGAVPTARVGGGSDGNFTGALGIPTLDGLGAVGGGAHAVDEHARIDELVPRLELLTALVRRLLEVGVVPEDDEA